MSTGDNKNMNLKTWVTKKCINVKAFSRKIGVCDGTLHRIINGRMPSLRVAIAIQDATEDEVNVRDLLPDKEKSVIDVDENNFS